MSASPRRFWIIIWMSVLAASTWALASGELTPDSDPWAQAQSLYAAGRYEDALAALKAHPIDTAAYYSNLGTLYTRLSKPGTALAYFEKAARLAPSDPGIQSGLDAAQDAATRAGEAPSGGESWEFIADQLPLGAMALGFALLCVPAVALMLRSRKRASFATSVALFAFLAAVGCFGLQSWIAARPPAVLTEPALVRSGPGDRFLELARLNAGSKLRALNNLALGAAPSNDAKNTWRQVQYDGGIGWVRASSLLLL